MSASPAQNKDVGIPSRKRQRVDKDMNSSIQVDSDHTHFNKLTSILNDLCKVDDKDKLDTMDLCHVPPTINAILQEMNDSIHTDFNKNIISLLVKILVKFHLLHSTNHSIKLKLSTTEQNFQNAYRQKAKQWVYSCFDKLMKPNSNISIVSLDALIVDSFQHDGILDLDSWKQHVLQVMQDQILCEQEERVTVLEFSDDCDLPNDLMGLVSSQLESFQNEQCLDSTSLVDLVLNE